MHAEVPLLEEVAHAHPSARVGHADRRPVEAEQRVGAAHAAVPQHHRRVAVGERPSPHVVRPALAALELEDAPALLAERVLVDGDHLPAGAGLVTRGAVRCACGPACAEGRGAPL